MTDASAAPDTTTAATEEDVHEQKAVRLAKRERLVCLLYTSDAADE